MDIYAFRINVNSMDTCYRVLGVAHNLYKPIETRFKDYIAVPKTNGYQSLHTSTRRPSWDPCRDPNTNTRYGSNGRYGGRGPLDV